MAFSAARTFFPLVLVDVGPVPVPDLVGGVAE
jgi:hypothetical protein